MMSTSRAQTSLVLILATVVALVSGICQEQTVRLNRGQLKAIRENLNTIEQLERNPSLLESYQEPIIVLSPPQKRIIASQQKEVFSGEKDLPPGVDVSLSVVSVTTPPPTTAPVTPYDLNRFFQTFFYPENGYTDTDRPRTRAPMRAHFNRHQKLLSRPRKLHGFQSASRSTVAAKIRVCEAKANLQPLVLALNSDGQLVQLVQIPESDMRQWIFREECLRATCTGVTGKCLCEEELRDIKALVVNLRTRQIETTWISAHRQCLAKLNMNP